VSASRDRWLLSPRGSSTRLLWRVAVRPRPAAVKITVISTSGNGLHLVQRQLSDRVDRLRLLNIPHIQKSPSGCIAKLHRVGMNEKLQSTAHGTKLFHAWRWLLNEAITRLRAAQTD
jgi:hypothetical protein